MQEEAVTVAPIVAGTTAPPPTVIHACLPAPLSFLADLP